MRTLRLVRIAAEAEVLRLRQQAGRAVVRAALGVIALGFLAAAEVFFHIAVWDWMRLSWDEPQAALVIAAADLAVAALLVVLATRLSPGRVEREALAVRRLALDSAAGSVATVTLVVRLLRYFVRPRSRG